MAAAGRMQLMATVDDAVAFQGILVHAGLSGARAGPRPPSSGVAARTEQPALPDMTLKSVPGARATAEDCAESPGEGRPLAASRLPFDLSRAL